MREDIIEAIENNKIITIVRGAGVEEAVKIADALYAGGIKLIEVTFNQKDRSLEENTCESIRRISEKYADDMIVGAGTVTSVELVEKAYAAGAKFIVSPDTDVAVIKRTLELGMVSLPGAYTATEVKLAHNSGADFVKLFPCIDNAPAYLKALSSPFNNIKFVAVGGVGLENCKDFMKAGAVGVGIGGNLVKKAWIESGDFHKMTEEAKKIIERINE